MIEVTCTTSNRDAILHVLSHETGVSPVYHFSPEFSYTVGAYTLLRNGRIKAKTDTGALRVLASLGLCDYPRVSVPSGDISPEAFTYPMTPHNGRTLLNLISILSARQRLLNRAIAGRQAFRITQSLVDCLYSHPPVSIPDFLFACYGREEEHIGIRFTLTDITLCGFYKGHPGEAHIHRLLSDRIIDTALLQSWAKPSVRNIRNKKYAMRTWLNAIGMTGPEYRELRQVLLSRLPGNASKRKM